METYNPRNNSFIQKPEAKCCITCGQPLTPDVKPMSNEMSRYINDISGRVVVMNGTADFVVVDGVTLRKEGVDKPKTPAELAAEKKLVEISNSLVDVKTPPTPVVGLPGKTGLPQGSVVSQTTVGKPA